MKKALVAFFSAGGVTGRLAERLAKAVGADLSEIEPRERYTAGDLDWRNPQSRSSVEMSSRASRPEIFRTVESMEQYDVVFIGFPVWWYREPSVIDTFMETYDFSGKTVVPFATSGGSGIGDSAANMQALASGAKVAAGKRFEAGTGSEELAEWAGQWL